MTPTNHLGLAMEWAHTVHGKQVDKLGRPYMGHVLAVAAACAPLGVDGICVALLHDTLEDATPIQLADLIRTLDAHFPATVNEAVRALTFRLVDGEETRDAYYQRILDAGMLATRVKLEDVSHNMDRVCEIEDAGTRERLAAKYMHAYRVLTDGLELAAA